METSFYFLFEIDKNKSEYMERFFEEETFKNLRKHIFHKIMQLAVHIREEEANSELIQKNFNSLKRCLSYYAIDLFVFD